MKSFRIALPLAAALLLWQAYGYRLWFPPQPYFDEIYHAETARSVARAGTYRRNHHPPLGYLAAAASIRLFGDAPSSWRLVSLASGVALVLAVYALAREVLGEGRPALFAAFLWACDGLSLTQARIAMLNAPMLLGMVLALLFFLRALRAARSGREGEAGRNFLWSGVFLGAALATRWAAVSTLGLMALIALRRAVALPGAARAPFVKACALRVLLPAGAVYAAAHLALPLITENVGWRDLWTLQAGSFRYHWGLKEGHRYGSEWWTWPLLLRPVWYFFREAGGRVNGVLAIGNPAVYWPVLPLLAYLAWQTAARTPAPPHRKEAATLLGAGILAHWLIWAFVGRVQFFHYFYTAMPFTVMGMGLVLERLWTAGPRGRAAVAIYLAVVLAGFAYWYPLLTGLPVSREFYLHHLWFKSWA